MTDLKPLSSKAAFLAVENAKWSRHLERWHGHPPYSSDPNPIEVWRSNRFLVQVFEPADGGQRITVNRTAIDQLGRWRDGITWDELQRIKAEIGRADRWAVEIYPPAGETINVANMRHLFLTLKPSYAWAPADALRAAGASAVDASAAMNSLALIGPNT